MKSKNFKISPYHFSFIKRILDIVLSVLFLAVSSPFFILILLMIRLSSGKPIFFFQNRIGVNGKVIKIIKFRTMVNNALSIQSKYKKLNEADGPVFKITKDPRFTKIGFILSRTGLDELPQFVNVLKGEMSIVGPRPLPVNEAHKLSKLQQIRESVKPGVTSTWVVGGSHKLSFGEWMRLDKKYVENAGFLLDLKIIYRTACLILGYTFRQVINH